jgi:hypothetical protein
MDGHGRLRAASRHDSDASEIPQPCDGRMTGPQCASVQTQSMQLLDRTEVMLCSA